MPSPSSSISSSIEKYKLIVFDLDGTLAPSKSNLEPAMTKALAHLLQEKKVAVISGCDYPQFASQLIHPLMSIGQNVPLSNLTLVPTSGTKMYTWQGNWQMLYKEDLSLAEKERIKEVLLMAIKSSGVPMPHKIYGHQIEDRSSQVTFSALGQKAPIAEKSTWDPERMKRKRIADMMASKLPEFDIRIGGMTSIDITKKGVNKSYGIRKLENLFGLSPHDILFVGDALFYGGNDYPVKATGVDCVSVDGPEDTLHLIEAWSNNDQSVSSYQPPSFQNQTPK